MLSALLVLWSKPMPEPSVPEPRMTERERYCVGLFEEHAASGKSIRVFAEEKGLSAGTLSWWKSEIRRREARRAGFPAPRRRRRKQVSFVPVNVTDGSGTMFNPGAFEVALPGGAAVRVPWGFDADSFARLVRVLRETC